jgi:hypothetical protein
MTVYDVLKLFLGIEQRTCVSQEQYRTTSIIGRLYCKRECFFEYDSSFEAQMHVAGGYPQEKRAIFRMCDLHRNMCPEGCVIERQTNCYKTGKDKEEWEYQYYCDRCAGPGQKID